MITMQLDDHGLAVRLTNARAVQSLAFQKAMRDVVAKAHAALQANMGDGGLIGVRTGMMKRAIKEEVTFDSDGVSARVYLDPTMGRYFDIQDEGGTITPKNAQFLTIPLAAMLTGNGVARGTARDVMSQPRAFGFESSFIAKGVIFGVQGRKGGKAFGSTIPLFALKSSVTIPGKHFIAQTMAQIVDWVQARLEAATGEIVQVLDGTTGA